VLPLPYTITGANEANKKESHLECSLEQRRRSNDCESTGSRVGEVYRIREEEVPMDNFESQSLIYTPASESD
jgi:hypothetical protein